MYTSMSDSHDFFDSSINPIKSHRFSTYQKLTYRDDFQYDNTSKAVSLRKQSHYSSLDVSRERINLSSIDALHKDIVSFYLLFYFLSFSINFIMSRFLIVTKNAYSPQNNRSRRYRTTRASTFSTCAMVSKFPFPFPLFIV